MDDKNKNMQIDTIKEKHSDKEKLIKLVKLVGDTLY